MLRGVFRALLLLVVWLPLGGAYASEPFEPWTQRLRPPTFGALTDVAFGYGRFVATGAAGTIVSSDDAVHWAQAVTGTDQNLNAVVLTDSDIFVAVGEKQMILISHDGINWTQTRSNQVGNLTGVAYGGGKYIAVGPGAFSGTGQTSPPIFLTSGDAIHWNEVSAPPSLLNVAYGNGMFMGLRVTGIAGNQVAMYEPFLITASAPLVSVNGIDWTSAQTIAGAGGPLGFKRIQFLDGQFFVTGLAYRYGVDTFDTAYDILAHSSDGQSWASKIIQGYTVGVSGVASGIGKYVAFGNGFHLANTGGGTFSANRPRVYNSTDGQNWNSQTWIGNDSARFNGIVFGDSGILPASGVFVAVGNEGINFSVDGVRWSQAFVSFSGLASYNTPTRAASFTAAAASSRAIVAVGTNWVATSTNGLDWTTQSVPYDLNAVSWGDFSPSSGAGLFLAGGKGVIGTSQDGFDWTWMPRAANYYSTLVTPGALLLAGDRPEGLSVSTNGTIWKTIYSDSFYTYSPYLPSSPRLLEYGNGVYVAAQLFLYGPGYNSQILSSSDAQSWSTNEIVPFSDGSWISDLRFGNGTFIASPGLWTSQDGKTWRQEAQPIPDARLGYGTGIFIAIGPDGTLKYSMTGHNWSSSANPWLPFANASMRPKAVVFAFNSFFIVGDGGLILQSSPISTAPTLSARLDGSNVALVLNAPPGTYHLLRTTSLSSWDDLGPVTIGNESDTLIYSGVRQFSQEFFKVIAQ